MIHSSLDIVHEIRRYMQKSNLRSLSFEEFGESLKITFSYIDGKTSEEES